MNEAFENLVAASMSQIRLPIPGLEFQRGLQARKFMVRLLSRPDSRRSAPADSPDIFARLTRTVTDEGERFDDQQIIDHMSFLMMAAHDTTTSTLSSMILRARQASRVAGDACARSASRYGTDTFDFDDLDRFADHRPGHEGNSAALSAATGDPAHHRGRNRVCRATTFRKGAMCVVAPISRTTCRSGGTSRSASTPIALRPSAPSTNATATAGFPSAAARTCASACASRRLRSSSSCTTSSAVTAGPSGELRHAGAAGTDLETDGRPAGRVDPHRLSEVTTRAARLPSRGE